MALAARHLGGGQQVVASGGQTPAGDHRPGPTPLEFGVHQRHRRRAFGVEVRHGVLGSCCIARLSRGQRERAEAPAGPGMTEVTEDHRRLAGETARGHQPPRHQVAAGQERAHPGLTVAVAHCDGAVVARPCGARRELDLPGLELRQAERHQEHPGLGELHLGAELDAGLEGSHRDLDRGVGLPGQHLHHRGLERRLAERPRLTAVQQRCDELVGPFDLTGEGREHRALGEQLVQQQRILDVALREPQDRFGVVAAAQAPEEVVGPGHREHRPVAAGPGERLDPGQDPLRLVAPAKQVERQPQQMRSTMPPRGLLGALERGLGEAAGHLGVAAEQCAPRPLDQRDGIRLLPAVEPPRGQAHRVVPAAHAGRLGGVRQPLQQPAPHGVGHGGAGHLGVDRVHRAELAAAAVDDQFDETGAHQLVHELEGPLTFQPVDTDRFAQGDGVEQLAGVRAEAVQPLLDQLGEPRGRGDRSEEEPGGSHQTQRARVAQAGHELAQVEQVAAADPGQRGRRDAVHAPVEHSAQQFGDRRVRQRCQVDAGDELVAPEHRDRLRHRLPGAQGQHRPDPSGHEQLQHQRRRGVVQGVHVVDRQVQHLGGIEPVDQMVHRRPQLGGLGPVGSTGADRHHLGERPERHARRRPGGPHPQHGTGDRPQRLVGQAGLADPRRPDEEHPGGVERPDDPCQLDVPPDQRPLMRHGATVQIGRTLGNTGIWATQGRRRAAVTKVE